MAAISEAFVGTSRFEVIRRLGSGGTGVVYEAFDRRRDVRVALKTLRRLDSRRILQIKHEFRALANISHPNVVTLYELISSGDDWFFTMELVNGVSFLDHVRPWRKGSGSQPDDDDSTQPPWRSRPKPARSRDAVLDVAALVPAVRQLAEGLRAVHRAGKLHRDLKPSNVLVGRDGRLVICDFGLTLDLADSACGDARPAVGTPRYMSPEQTTGAMLDEASDWYSVGAMIYQALSGRAPFEGSAEEVIAGKRTSDAPAIDDASAPADLIRLCMDLLARNPSARPSGSQVLTRLDVTHHERDAGTRARAWEDAPFVGRHREMAALLEAFCEARAGHGTTVHVVGSSGIGKTALVRCFLDEVRLHDAIVLAGRCYQRESVQYKAVDNLIDALCIHLMKMRHDEVAALLPADMPLLARLFPVLRRIAPRLADTLPDTDPKELRRRAVAALRALLGKLAARRPVVVWVDDIQWGDLDSAELLAQLTNGPDAPAILLVTCCRDDDVETSPVSQRLVDARIVRIDGLSPPEARELATSLLRRDHSGLGARADTIAAESNGVPLWVTELVLHAETGRGDSLDHLVGQRFRDLAEPEQRLVCFVAVAGQPMPRSVITRAAQLGAVKLRVISNLIAERWVRIRGERESDEIEIVHDRMREVVLARLSTDDLVGYHRRLAEALEADGNATPESLVEHWLGAHDTDRASRHARQAAERAADTLAFDRAARLYQLAIDLGHTDVETTLALREQLAHVLAHAGRGAAAAASYMAAASGATDRSVELRRRGAEELLRSGHFDEGFAAIRQVLAEVGLAPAKSTRRALLSIVWRRALLKLRGLGYSERDAAEVPSRDLERIDVAWSAASALGMIDPIRGTELQNRHLLLALASGEPYRVARGLALETTYLAIGGGKQERRTARLADIAVSLAERVAHPHALGLAAFVRCDRAFLLGHWREAREHGDRAEAILRDRCTGAGLDVPGIRGEITTIQNFTLSSLVYLGELAELGRRVPVLLADAERRADRYAANALRGWRSNVSWLANDDVIAA
ncbi:MAG TPA: protein kinase, partial [Kofleriaceae bacterium]|nr:protein kinase [Kofleriaceae bacterium]